MRAEKVCEPARTQSMGKSSHPSIDVKKVDTSPAPHPTREGWIGTESDLPCTLPFSPLSSPSLHRSLHRGLTADEEAEHLDRPQRL